jgi:hypothetical protein
MIARQADGAVLGFEPGNFTVNRKRIGKRIAAKLNDIQAKLRSRIHARLKDTVEWLQRVMRAYFRYHALPGNMRRLRSFRREVERLWYRTLRRRR